MGLSSVMGLVGSPRSAGSFPSRSSSAIVQKEASLAPKGEPRTRGRGVSSPCPRVILPSLLVALRAVERTDRGGTRGLHARATVGRISGRALGTAQGRAASTFAGLLDLALEVS